MLAEFCVWAGEMLGGENGGGGGSIQETARRYVSGRTVGGAASSSAAAVDDDCSICQEGLSDAVACDELGEPVVTQCGHRFHAQCFARLMEESRGEHDPPCPMCRSEIGAVRFA